MKKTARIILTLMLGLSLVSCGNGNAEKQPENSGVSENTYAPAENVTEAETVPVTEAEPEPEKVTEPETVPETIPETIHETGSATEAPVSEKGSIVFAEVYTNWAWGYQCKGTITDDRGDVYTFDFSDRDSMKQDALADALREFYYSEDSKPAYYSYRDREELRDILENKAAKVNADAELTSEHRAYDAGQNTLYVFDLEGNMKELCSHGDYMEELQDDTAKEIVGFYKNN